MNMDLERELQAALAPREPGSGPMDAVMARLSSRPAKRGGSRTILIGTVLVVAAAASMLAWQLAGRPAPPPVAAAPPSSTASSAVVQAAVAVEDARAPRPAASPAVKSESKKPGTVVQSFTVRVDRMQNNSTNVAARRAVDTYYTSLLDGLRAIPGLVLVTPESTGFAPDAPFDYRLTPQGSDLNGDKFLVMLRAKSVVRGLILPIQTRGDIDPACTGSGDASCSDPVSMAASVVRFLRTNMFPAEPDEAQQLSARILDSSLNALDRLHALRALSLHNSLSGGPRVDTVDTALNDASFIRSIADLGATASDPAIRALVWLQVRDLGGFTELIPALVQALRTDPDDKVRLEAATTLVQDYPKDPQSQAALEAAARDDPRPAVRAMARRGLLGEAGWNEHIVSSLKNTGLTPAERIEPLLYNMNRAGKRPDLSKLLADDTAIEAFADAFPRALAAPGAELPATVLLSSLDSLYHPAITGVLLDSLERTRQPAVRQTIVSYLIKRNKDERVQAVFRKLSIEDADPELRKMAAGALHTEASAVAR
jgi:flagellar basal body-associated protein FliL